MRGLKKKKSSNPMSAEHRRILRSNRKMIVKDLDVKYIIDDLITKGIITTEMKNSIMANKEPTSQASTLLDTLERRGDAAFGILLEVLKESYHFLYKGLLRESDPDQCSQTSTTPSEQDGDVRYAGRHYRLPQPIDQTSALNSTTDDDDLYDIYDHRGCFPYTRKYHNQSVEQNGCNVLLQGVIICDTLGFKVNTEIGHRRASEGPKRNVDVYTRFYQTNPGDSYVERGARPKKTPLSLYTNINKMNSTSMPSVSSLSSNEGRGELAGDTLISREEYELKKGTKVMVDVSPRAATSEKSNTIWVYDVIGNQIEIERKSLKIHGEATGQDGIYPQPITRENAFYFLKGQPMGTFIIYEPLNQTSSNSCVTELALVTSAGTTECFPIRQFSDSSVGFDKLNRFTSIDALLEHYKTSRGDLPISLRRPLSNLKNISYLLSLLPEDLNINQKEIEFKKSSSPVTVPGFFKEAMYRDREVSVRTGAADRTLVGLENTIEEVKLLAELEHDNVLKCFGASVRSESNISVVTESIGRGDIRTFLAEEFSTMPDSHLMHFTLQILSAVSYLHSKYIIHRGLFVRNIFIDNEMNVKLGGFGGAKKAVNNCYRAEEHEAIASNWCAPEVTQSGNYSTYSDAWDVALTILDIFNGGLRTPCKTNKSLSGLIIEGVIPKGPERCPKKVFNVLRQCLEKVPVKRMSVLKIFYQLSAPEPFYEELDSSAEEQDEEKVEVETGAKREIPEIPSQQATQKSSKLNFFWRRKEPSPKKKEPFENSVTKSDSKVRAHTRL